MLNIICNPIAGKGKAKKLVSSLENHLKSRGAEYALYFSQKPGHARELAAKIGGGDIVCMGGDGTLHEIVNGVPDLGKIRLGLIPCGTGNDFAKALKIPAFNVEAAADIILSGNVKAADIIGFDNGLRSANVAGMGIDVDVLERMRRAKLIKGRLAYYIALIKSLIFFRWNSYQIQLDGGNKLDRTAMITAVCNGRFFGGGMEISPLSEPFDGKLDVIIVNKLPRILIPKMLLGFFTGKLLKNKYVEHFKCEKVEFFTDAKPVINADGELIYGSRFSCSVLRGPLSVFVPGEALKPV